MNDLANLLTRARQMRGLMLIAVAVGVFVGLLVTFKVSLAPPALKSREYSRGVSSVDVIVNAEVSVTNLNLSIDALAQRAQIFAQFASTPKVRELIAIRSRLDPQNLVINASAGSAGAAAGGQQSAPQAEQSLLTEVAGYRLEILPQPGLPIISVNAQAPTAAEATKLASAGADGLIGFVTQLARTEQARPRKVRPVATQVNPAINAGLPDAGSVTLKRLGSPTGGEITGGGGYMKGMLVALFVFIAVATAIIFISGLKDELRVRARSLRELQATASDE